MTKYQDDKEEGLGRELGGRFIYLYGPMGSGKSSALVRIHDSLRQEGHGSTARIGGDKPRTSIRSRTGAEVPAIPVNDHDWDAVFEGTALLIDEVQFLTRAQVDEIAMNRDRFTFVVCAGLLLDHTGHVFEGSLQLLSMADVCLPCTPLPPCHKCGAPAIGDELLGGNSTERRRYLNVCSGHVVLVGSP